MLVVVENGNVALFLELPLNLEAPGGGDILQVDAAEGAGNQIHGVDEFVHILGFYADGEGVHVAEGLEQGALALHNGHTRLRADVAQAKYGGAVGDDGAQVVPPGQLIGFVYVLLNFQTGGGHAGSIGQGQVVLGSAGYGAGDFDLAAPLLVQPQGFFCVVHREFLLIFSGSQFTLFFLI